ncbi:MAG: right-handed parallel beta-helix repeat-containing protein, partial [Planctomycetota bacterium]
MYGDHVNPDDPEEPLEKISPVISENTFINNLAINEHGFMPPDTNYPENDHGDGGAIVAFQGVSALIINNLIENNGAQAYGGGLHLRQWSDGVIENNQILNNGSALGAGLHITFTSNPNIKNNLIKGNSAGLLGGGGIYIYNESEPLVENNIITENDCINGAGIAVYNDSNPIIRNNLIYKNKNGAGIRVRGGSAPYIYNNTIVSNTAQSYSGGVDYTFDSSGELVNNIITSSGSGYGIYVDQEITPLIRNNNVWNNSAGNYGPSIADKTGQNGNISSETRFINSADADFHLNYDSICLDAGDPNYSYILSGEQDFENNPRNMGQATDMGAYETWPVWNITSKEKYITIQQAIDDSNNSDCIIVTKGTYYENPRLNGKNVKLTSTDPNNWQIVRQTVIDGNNMDTVVLFESGEDANCVLAGFTITNGQASGDYGGGMRIRNYSGPTIRNNIIRNNKAKQGAGINMYHSFSRIYNNRIYNNYGPGTSQG